MLKIMMVMEMKMMIVKSKQTSDDDARIVESLFLSRTIKR